MNKKLLVVSAVWCPSCLIMKKHLKKLNTEYPNLDIEYLDYDLDEEEVNKYEIGSTLPVIILENNERLLGEKKYEEIINFLESNNVI